MSGRKGAERASGQHPWASGLPVPEGMTAWSPCARVEAAGQETGRGGVRPVAPLGSGPACLRH